MKLWVCKDAKKIIRERFFPIVLKNGSFKNFVVVGVGGNIGDTPKRFRNLFRFWLNDRRLKIVETSPILLNPAFGYKNQNDFFNAIMLVQTSLDSSKFLSLLLHTEKCFKRKRSFSNSPRTLDLDIIFFNNEKHKKKRLTIPHKEYHKRASVIIPMGLLTKI